MENKIKQIAEHFGKMVQTAKACEELAELICELTRDIITDDRRENIVEEMADVEIMLEQMKHFYNITDDELATEKEYKIERTLERIEKLKEN